MSNESSGGSGKKENSLAAAIGANAGDFALNIFDKFKKKNQSTNSVSSTSNNSSQNQTDSNSLISNALSNLAISFHKNLANKSENRQLVIIDDDTYDDEDKNFKSEASNSNDSSLNKSKTKIPASQSVYDINKSSKLTELKTSATTTDLNKFDSNTESKSSVSINNIAQTPSSSNSFQKISAVFDEILNKKRDSDESTDSKKKKFFKTKVVNNSNSQSNNASTVTTPVNSNNKSLDLSSTDLNNASSNLTTLHEEINSIASKSEVDSNINEPIDSINQTTLSTKNDEKKTLIDDNSANNNLNNNISKTDHNHKNSYTNNYFFPILLAIFATFFYILPKNFSYFLFTYTFGLANGALLAIFIFYLIVKLDFLKYILKDKKFSSLLGSSLNDINDSDLKDDENNTEDKIKNLLIQSCLTKENRNFDGIYRGWMNELREVYDPSNYFLNKTRSVYVNLDGTMLRLQTTTSRIPKRTVCGESIPQVTFNEQRIYDLTGCDIFILPKELVRKRYWSKKYPLCIKGAKLLNAKSFNQSISSTSVSSAAEKSFNRNTSSLNISDLANEDQSILNTSQQLEQDTIILFGRCDREKEEWFKLFKKSSKKLLMESNQYLKLNRSSASFKKRESLTSNENTTAIVCDITNERLVYKIKNEEDSNNTETSSSTKSSENLSQDNLSNSNIKNMTTQTNQCLIYDTSLTVINTFLIRILADFFNSKDYIKKIQTKIQNKLNTISVPYFMESLVITDLNLGNVIPLIRETSEPWHDERGLWVHLDIDYSGGFQMSLATKLNLMKLKSSASTPSKESSPSSSANLNTMFSFKNLANSAENNNSTNEDEQCLSMFTSGLNLSGDNTSFNSELSSNNESTATNNSQEKFKRKTFFNNNRKRHLGMVNSDEEDSPESSGDEYVHTGYNDEDNKLIETVNPSKKLLNIVSKIASSNYFQKATDNKFIKMAMENVSNCQLMLNVEVKRLTGKLAINIPTHPSDRIWYGFVRTPKLTIVATPQVGEKEVTYKAVSEWIAEKLKQEFQKVLVFPNMDDFYIPLLKSEAW